jgi:trimethylamine--corrinoid protein Co-methyltransferase
MIRKEHLLKVVDGLTLDRIHHHTIRVLEDVGVVFDSDEILTIFRKNGAKVDGRKAFITDAMVTAALKSCPRSFTMVGRSDNTSVRIGEDQERMAISPGNGTLYVQDMDGERRKATLEDFNTITRLCEQSRHVHLVGGVPVEPCDIPAQSRPARLVHSLMLYSHKPLIGVAATQQEAKEVFDIMEIAFGSDSILDEKVAIAYSVNPASPLCFEPLSCETLLAYAKRKQALFILPGLMAGVSGPLDLFGLVVLSNTEILAALVCTQLIQPGTPVVYSPGTFMVNMKNIHALTASPQGNLTNLAGLQMARQYYGLPARTMAGLTDAKQVDFQAGAETMQNLVLYTLAGAHIINECLGVMDSILVTSFEKWILDEELLERVHCLEKGFHQMASETAVESIKAVGTGGSYLMHPGTMANCRNVWMPAVSDWSSYDAWKKNGGIDILQKAHQRFKQRMESSFGKVLSPEIDQDISRYLEKK